MTIAFITGPVGADPAAAAAAAGRSQQRCGRERPGYRDARRGEGGGRVAICQRFEVPQPVRALRE
jgi:hypothetical protein